MFCAAVGCVLIKKNWKIEISMNICWWGEVKVIYHCHFKYFFLPQEFILEALCLHSWDFIVFFTTASTSSRYILYYKDTWFIYLSDVVGARGTKAHIRGPSKNRTFVKTCSLENRVCIRYHSEYNIRRFHGNFELPKPQGCLVNILKDRCG